MILIKGVNVCHTLGVCDFPSKANCGIDHIKIMYRKIIQDYEMKIGVTINIPIRLKFA